MKYWVYKNSRILGPLEKDAVAGVPGLDNGTMVCAGDRSAVEVCDWRPLGDVADLAALPLKQSPRSFIGHEFSAIGLIDELEVDIPDLGAEDDLFEDVDMGGVYGGALTVLPSAEQAELKREKEHVVQLGAGFEAMRKRAIELEASQEDLARRLTEKNLTPPSRPEPAKMTSAAPEQVEVQEPILQPLAKKNLFEKKIFRIIPTLKTFRPVAPASETILLAEQPRVAPVPSAPEVHENLAIQAPPAPSVAETPEVLKAPAATPAPPALEPASVTAPSFFNFADNEPKGEVPVFVQEEAPAPPVTAPSPAEDLVNESPAQEALARLAKPAPTPATVAPRKVRSNKAFLIGAAALVVILAGVGLLFFRHPKELKQMAELDDGRARLGAESTEGISRPPVAKPKMTAPEPNVSTASSLQTPGMQTPTVPESPQAASQPDIDAAINAVKNFPLDGERGTVSRWLQFSYSASPNVGKESWGASKTSEKTYLVEYRFTPARGGEEAHYLFEVDMKNGLVVGKNLDAKSVLAGGPRAAVKVPRSKGRRKPAVRVKKSFGRRKDETMSTQAPLLPLPSAGDLRPPSEDDGVFRMDTVHSGL